MKKEIMLSVIVPVYNTEKYLERCLDSINVALKNFKYTYEVLIINDGSTGNEEKIIKKYLSDNFFYFKKENKGLANTKNFGIEKSNGLYLSFIDSDDYIDENFYNESFDNYITKNFLNDIVIYDWETIDEKNNSKYIVQAKNFKYKDDKLGCMDCMIMPSSCNKIVKKELFYNLRFPDGYIYEDLATTPILFCRTNKIKYINKPYYKYYLSESSIMRSNFSKKNLQMIDIFDILFERLGNEDKLKSVEKEKIIYEVFTRRFYESILEPMIELNFKERYKLLRILSGKIREIKIELKNNYYLNLKIKSNGTIKSFFNKFLMFSLYNKFDFMSALLITKRLYYKLIHIKYTSM